MPRRLPLSRFKVLPTGCPDTVVASSAACSIRNERDAECAASITTSSASHRARSLRDILEVLWLDLRFAPRPEAKVIA
jgi:hypothetical protein